MSWMKNLNLIFSLMEATRTILPRKNETFLYVSHAKSGSMKKIARDHFARLRSFTSSISNVRSVTLELCEAPSSYNVVVLDQNMVRAFPNGIPYP